MEYRVKRYGKNSYGETIFTGKSVKDCLAYLRAIAMLNRYQFIRSNRSFKVTYAPYGKVSKTFRIE